MKSSALDIDRVSVFLRENLRNSSGPFSFSLFSSGGSNLTYLVEDSNGLIWVLRRPPTSKGLATAHDMSREWNILQQLQGIRAVPVPRVDVFCSDVSITGSEFYVMEYIPGVILRSRADAENLARQYPSRCVHSLVETHVALHNIDINEVGLNSKKHVEPYVLRQLRRWKQQIDDGAVRDVHLLDELHSALLDSYVAVNRSDSIVHGDYRFDNVVLGPDCSVVSILDWELSTVGDPVADFVWSAQYWADNDDVMHWLPDAPTLATSFPSRKEVLDLYRELSGMDSSDIDWLVVFSWWKQACISEGVYARRMKGIGAGNVSGSTDAIAKRVDGLAEVASDLAQQFL